jgi:ferredoxin
MFLHAISRNRRYHLGPFPLEVLPRDDSAAAREAARARREPPARAEGRGLLAAAAAKYREIFEKQFDGKRMAGKAPVPDDLARRAVDAKGVAYFMDASQVGICRAVPAAWLGGAEGQGHTHAVVILVERCRVPERDNLAHEWIAPALGVAEEMRAAEIAACLAGHIRNMGWSARGHSPGSTVVDLGMLAVLSGLAVRDGEALRNPYVEAFALAAVTTDYEMAADRPLAAAALAQAKGLRYWWGRNGAQSGRERNRRARRASHLGRYPMETVKRVARPTTLILDDEVPRVPKRAAFFDRALHGDLGERSKKERTRFSFKTPLSFSQLALIRSMVPFQNGPVAEVDTRRYADPEANARALKALSYYLGADITGICEIPRYAWFSHGAKGEAIVPYHRYAVVMLIDQGFDTMEGASGDDWISGAQSMRAYLRGAEIAGVMAEVLRGCGFPARSQTNADSDVLHIPLVLWAGLGELSRIGELVLNPFIGPRFKTVVLTTDMPLAVDRPVDFGLQTFCNNCLKCARECPCDAIPWGDKVMFNGYEIWKPDVERCTRYRLTNAKGAACGRCMKTCPLNKVVDADGPILARIASWLGIHAMWLKPVLVPIATWLDDRIGNGRRNPVKKWWFDHEIVDGTTIAAKGTNQRDLDPGRKLDPAKQTIAFYHASMMPPPDAAGPYPLDRKAALAAARLVESPAEAKQRKVAGGAVPGHYLPTPPSGEGGGQVRPAGAVRGPYQT